MKFLKDNWRYMTMIGAALGFLATATSEYLDGDLTPTWQELAMVLVFAYLKKGPGDLTKNEHKAKVEELVSSGGVEPRDTMFPPP